MLKSFNLKSGFRFIVIIISLKQMIIFLSIILEMKETIDMLRLILITVRFIQENSIIDLSQSSSSCRPESYWGQICSLYHGFFDKVKSLNIYSMWKRNQKNYQKEVKEKLALEKKSLGIN
jgi:hypothetical protein